jgi:C4-dicarboxylate transporter, DctQ subunit
MLRLHAFEDRLRKVVPTLIVVLFLLMLSLSIGQVVLRHFFNGGIIWADPLSRRLVLWVGLLGAILTTGEGKHFRIELLDRSLSPRMRRLIGIISSGISAVICIAMVFASLSYVELVSIERDAGLGSLPMALVVAVIPCAYFLLAIQFSIRAVMHTEEPSCRNDTLPAAEATSH